MVLLVPLSHTALDTGENLWTPDPFAALLERDGEAIAYLLEASPYDPASATMAMAVPLSAPSLSVYRTVTGGEVSVRLSDLGYTTGADDDPPHTPYPARLDEAYSISSRLFANADPFGAAQISVGQVVIANGSGELDHLLDLSWAGRELVIRAGGIGFSLTEFATVFRGSCVGCQHDESSISLVLRDRLDVLDYPLYRPVYAGTGGAEGGSDLKGKPKPVSLGKVEQVTPVLVDPALAIFQVHHRRIAGMDAVRNRGVPLTLTADYPDYASLSAAPLTADQVGTCLSLGLFRLGSLPDQASITADLRGDAVPDYQDTGAALLVRVLTGMMGPANRSVADFEPLPLAELSSKRPWSLGWYVATEDITAGTLVSGIMRSVGGWIAATRAGRILVGLIEPVSITDAVIGYGDVGADGVSRAESQPPAWKIEIGYRRMWTLLSDNQLAGAVGSADRSLWRDEYRVATWQDGHMRTFARDSSTIRLDTALTSAADAATLANILGSELGRPAVVYTVPITGQPFRHWLGKPVTLVYPRFGLDAGAKGRVIGVSENAKSGEKTIDIRI